MVASVTFLLSSLQFSDTGTQITLSMLLRLHGFCLVAAIFGITTRPSCLRGDLAQTSHLPVLADDQFMGGLVKVDVFGVDDDFVRVAEDGRDLFQWHAFSFGERETGPDDSETRDDDEDLF